MDSRYRILESRLWAYFGVNPDAISPEAIEVLERNSANIRQIAKSDGRLDAIVSRLTQDLFANDDETCADVLEAVAKELRGIVQNSTIRHG